MKNQEVNNEDYRPFGLEWRDEVSKMPKKSLVHFYRRSLIEKNKMTQALEEITKGKGRFDANKLIHASNTIKDMRQLAKEALS